MRLMAPRRSRCRTSGEARCFCAASNINKIYTAYNWNSSESGEMFFFPIDVLEAHVRMSNVTLIGSRAEGFLLVWPTCIHHKSQKSLQGRAMIERHKVLLYDQMDPGDSASTAPPSPCFVFSSLFLKLFSFTLSIPPLRQSFYFPYFM